MKNSSCWGRAFIDGKKSVEAGSYCTINYRFEAGHPIDDCGVIKIVFRHAADFGTPQFSTPEIETCIFYPTATSLAATVTCFPEAALDILTRRRPLICSNS